MLDIKFIRENLNLVKENIKNRGMAADADLAVALYEEKVGLQQEIDSLRQKRNANADAMKAKLSAEERAALIDEGKALKEKIAELEKLSAEKESAYSKAMLEIPNMAHPEVPVGKEEKDNTEIKRVGIVPTFGFKPKDHVELADAAALDLVDFEAAAKVSGPKFYYLKNEAVLLEMALIRYTLDILRKKGFILMKTPDIAKEEVAAGIGFNPRGDESNIYTIEGTGTCLIGTSEITLGGYYSDKIFDKANLPIKMAGISNCFRREAGSAGKHSKGLFRVHQFTKVEMFVYCLPEESDSFHKYILETEEEIFQGLGIPYRVVDTCSGDLGAAAYRKFDLEAWMPGRENGGDWGEITSTSNCTDFQARRLGIRYKSDSGNRFVHMLNGTAMALTRAIVCILENFQQEDGSVVIPKNLVPYTGFDRIVKGSV
ncbi:MAG: serine--tRNA ligase [Spirochaetes bacterium]|nr:serine--tRNA ligase [Spirochaetota bacterium]